ncbi:hypothetical protein GX586_07790 [bacterium]|nr:hypothetical protein [bacterium]
MTSRERTLRSLAHQPVDRLPVDFWASDAMIARIESAFSTSYRAFLDAHDIDLRYIDGPAYIGPALENGRDIWGVPRVTVRVPVKYGTEVYKDVTDFPLARATAVADVEQYDHWPSPDWFDYSPVKAQCDALHEQGRAVVFMGDRMNRVAQLKPAMYIRGVENILMDLALNPDIAHEIINRIRAFYEEYLRRILDAARGGIDIVFTGDDFGSQNGPLMSLAMWRAFIRTGFGSYIRIAKDHGCTVMHHTCGAVSEMLPDMIDCGLDVLQSVQPEAAGMSLAALKKRYGARIGFHGGISIQQTRPFGTPADIERDVSAIRKLFKDDGGYIFCTAHNIQADTPIENVAALLEAYRHHPGASG